MALLILEPGDICEAQDRPESGYLAGKTVILIDKVLPTPITGTTWNVHVAETDGSHTINEKYLNLIQSV